MVKKLLLTILLALIPCLAFATDVPINFYSRDVGGVDTPLNFYSRQTGGCGSDGYSDDANTVLLLKGESGPPFIDSSHQNHTMTNGTNIITSETMTHGCGSIFIPTNQLIQSSDSDDWTFGTGAFAVESCVKTPSTPVPSTGIFLQSDSVAPYGWFLAWGNSGGSGRVILGWKRTSTGSDSEIISTSTFSSNSWYHIEVDRASNTLYFFVNGTLIGTVDVSPSFPNNKNNFVAADGVLSVGSTSIDEYVDEVRITKGAYRHTTNFGVYCNEYGIHEYPINFYSRTQ